MKVQVRLWGRKELDQLIPLPTLFQLAFDLFVFCFFFSRNLVSDKQDSLAQCADFRNNLPSQEAMLCSGPLAVIQGRTSKYALNCFIWSACLSFFPITYSCICISELVLETLIVPKVILSSQNVFFPNLFSFVVCISVLLQDCLGG